MNNNYLPRGKLDAIKNPYKFLSFLHQRDIICPEDVSYLVWLLKGVGCTDLAASIEKQGKILVKTLVQIALLRLSEAFIVFPLWIMRFDRPHINSCQVFDEIKVDLAASAWKKIDDKDLCAKMCGIFHGRRVCICKLRLPLITEFGTDPIVSSYEITA